MEDTISLFEVNVKEERFDVDLEENTIYLPISHNEFKAESDFQTDNTMKDKIKSEYETEERHRLDTILADDFSPGFYHVNIKTESYNLQTHVEEMGLTASKTDGLEKCRALNEFQTWNQSHANVSEYCARVGTTANDDIHTRKVFNKQHVLATIVKRFDCSVCQKNFRNASNLKRHELVHTGVKPHECSVCQRKFRLVHHLNNHMLIHSGIMPHECSVCQKKFRDAGNFKSHSLKHTGVKPYECNVCQRKFRVVYHLNNHMLIHTGVKSHECGVCQKRFTQSSHLKTHMLIHVGAKPHKCSVCQKHFREAGSLRKHMVIHTRVKPR